MIRFTRWALASVSLCALVSCSTSAQSPRREDFSLAQAASDSPLSPHAKRQLAALGRVYSCPDKVEELEEYLLKCYSPAQVSAFTHDLSLVPSIELLDALRKDNWALSDISALLHEKIAEPDINMIRALSSKGDTPATVTRAIRTSRRLDRHMISAFSPEYVQSVLDGGASLSALVAYSNAFNLLARPHPKWFRVLESHHVGQDLAKEVFKDLHGFRLGSSDSVDDSAATYVETLLDKGYSLREAMQLRQGDFFLGMGSPIPLERVLEYHENGFRSAIDALSLNAMSVPMEYARSARAVSDQIPAQEVGYAYRNEVGITDDAPQKYRQLAPLGVSFGSVKAIDGGLKLDQMRLIREHFNTKYFERYDASQLAQMASIADGSMDVSTVEPVFVFLSDADWNGSSYDRGRVFSRGIASVASSSNVVLLMYEGKSEADLIQASQRFVRLTGRKIRNGVVCGHANPSVMRIGNGDSEEAQITADDTDLFDSFKSSLERDAHVWFASCSLGKGDEPLAQVIAQELGASVEGALYDVTVNGLDWDSQNRRVSVRYGALAKPPFSRTFVPSR